MSSKKNLLLPVAAAVVVLVAVIVVVALPGGSDDAASTSAASSEDAAVTADGTDAEDTGKTSDDAADAGAGDAEGTTDSSASTVSASDSLAAQEAATAFSSDEDVVITASELSTAATYYDYDADGTTVQVFAITGSDGSIRVALNTCQVCAGSTKAYFVQEGDVFVCQNCKNEFPAEVVGVEASGCNPIPVTSADYELDGGDIVIPASFLSAYASAFANWKA